MTVETSPDYLSETPASKGKGARTSNRKETPISDKTYSHYQTHQRQASKGASTVNGYGKHVSSGDDDVGNTPISGKRKHISKSSFSPADYISDESDDEMHNSVPNKQANCSNSKKTSGTGHVSSSLELRALERLREENHELKERYFS